MTLPKIPCVLLEITFISHWLCSLSLKGFSLLFLSHLFRSLTLPWPLAVSNDLNTSKCQCDTSNNHRFHTISAVAAWGGLGLMGLYQGHMGVLGNEVLWEKKHKRNSTALWVFVISQSLQTLYTLVSPPIQGKKKRKKKSLYYQ